MHQSIIVVPCYNEAARLDVVSFRQFVASSPAVKFVFVNDGSTDGTNALLEHMRRVEPLAFDVVHLDANVGKAGAVRAGVLAALAQDPVHVGYWDADLATPLTAIQSFCALLEERSEIELVMGARVKLLGRRIERRAPRHYLGRVFAAAASVSLNLAVYDTQCGAKLFRASERVRQVFSSPFRSRWIFDVEVLARLSALRRQAGLGPLDEAVYELPLIEWRDVKGSKLTVADFGIAALDLARIYWRRHRADGRGAAEKAALVSPAASGDSGIVPPLASPQTAREPFVGVDERI